MAYESVVLADSPSAFWPCQDASGGLVDDAGSRDASETGSGHSYGLSGPGGYLSVGLSGNSLSGWQRADENLWSSTAFSVEAWVYWPSLSSSQQFVAAKATTTANHEWSMSLYNAGGAPYATGRVATNADVGWLDVQGAVTSGRHCGWHHVVMTLGATPPTLKMYVDGVNTQTDSVTSGSRASNSAGLFGIGFRHNLPNGYAGNDWAFDGQLTMVAFYDFALTSGQVADHYAAMPGCHNAGWSVGFLKF